MAKKVKGYRRAEVPKLGYADPWGSVTTAQGVRGFVLVSQSINVCPGLQKVPENHFSNIVKSNSSQTTNRTASDTIAAVIAPFSFVFMC